MNTYEYRSLDFESFDIPSISRLQAELDAQMYGHARRNHYGPGESEQYDDWEGEDDDSDDEYADYDDWDSEDEKGYYGHNFEHDYNR